jgi:23S rRNA (guanosine2251-2'-O)-methyltransferase
MLPGGISAVGWKMSVNNLPASVLLHNVRSLYNVGAFFRTCDAVGVTRLHLSGFTGSPPSSGISKTALGAEQTVPWERSEPVELIEQQRRAGCEVAAIDTFPDAIDLFDWQPAFPVLVVFGHEVEGLPSDIVTACDTRVRIAMAGAKRSLNVATAGGVVLYELLRKHRGHKSALSV